MKNMIYVIWYYWNADPQGYKDKQLVGVFTELSVAKKEVAAHNKLKEKDYKYEIVSEELNKILWHMH